MEKESCTVVGRSKGEKTEGRRLSVSPLWLSKMWLLFIAMMVIYEEVGGRGKTREKTQSQSRADFPKSGTNATIRRVPRRRQPL